jgi:hypothetical protein
LAAIKSITARRSSSKVTVGQPKSPKVLIFATSV